MASHTLALHASDSATYEGYASAAMRAGMDVLTLDDQPRTVVLAARRRPYFRAPGGLLAAAISLSASIEISGPTPAWFVQLGPSVTGRRWELLNIGQLRQLVTSRPMFAKLADAKVPGFPARWWRSPAEVDVALSRFGSEAVQMLATDQYLSIHSEYRVFTLGRSALSCSPYLVEDEPWTPLLRTHRASFHAEAMAYIDSLLPRLHAVPPAAALDVARLDNGEFILLEANQAWSAAPYSCDPAACLRSVIAANESRLQTWQWKPDPGLSAIFSRP